ncbi:hypothetical protein A2U01_0090005 [Trifolium medium]|uniref:Uncharacterized protein n=1 Tax=Trifolium medium TaxID=97028 RepID=A0A392U7J0_9FABA|nr:hypothetical protein [Trifolium medium]
MTIDSSRIANSAVLRYYKTVGTGK